jgi:UDP-glucose-4-epimerase GalE
LVTGGAGYIGSHFCKAAARAGHSVVVYDNLSTGHREFCRFGPLVEGDLLDTNKLRDTLIEHRIEGVVHFAAKALVGESIQYPDLYHRNNTLGTQSLVEALKAHPVEKFVFSSSCATYGLARAKLMAEDHPQEPINPYGESKLECEKLLLERLGSYSRALARLRYFNVVGCDPEGELQERHEPETHIVPNILKAVKNRSTFQIFGDSFPTDDGTCIRDYVDVNDLAQAHLAALEELNRRELLTSNVGSARGYSNLEVLAACERAWGRKVERSFAPAREGDPPRLVADNGFFKSWCRVELRSLEKSLEPLAQLL